jgi:autotransporter translocation and assembly factor TamB
MDLKVGRHRPRTRAGIHEQLDNVISVQSSGTGTASPNVNGAVLLNGGAFDVATTGVRYTDMTADLQFKDQHLQIEALRLVDSHGDALQVQGGLDVLGETAGRALDVRVTADDFEVLNNRGQRADDGDRDTRRPARQAS